MIEWTVWIYEWMKTHVWFVWGCVGGCYSREQWWALVFSPKWAYLA